MKKSACSVNKTLFPLKMTLFFFSASAYAILPYLTIHMKDIGISDLDIALIYTILPFCVFIAPPIVGFFGDKMGNFKRVLQLSVLMTGLFHTLLLAVPKNTVHKVFPDTSVNLVGNNVLLSWQPCLPDNATSLPEITQKKKVDIKLFDCSTVCQDVCTILTPYCTEKNSTYNLKTMVANTTQISQGSSEMSLAFHPDPCTGQTLPQMYSLPSGCSMECKAQTNLIGYCDYIIGENRLTTNSVYFVLRMLATMALACVFIMLDAQTIQMCKIEEELGNKGAYGRQILYKTLAQAIISPLVGILMDKITEMTGSTNYVAPFVISDILLIITFICICFVQGDIGLPKDGDTWEGIKIIFTNISMLIYLIMMFVCGCCYGFVETFLFVYLKEDLHAPIYLLGLTITTGALVSIPFLYYSDWIIKKVGMVNVIILALIMYGVRYVGYSYITCAWFAFPFEALEVFTLFLLRVASSKYIQVQAPPGTLATMSGLSGGAHFGFGKGMGGLIGGVLKDQYKNTAMAFRVFGMGAFGAGVLYAAFHAFYGRKIDERMMAEKEKEKEAAELNKFIIKENNQQDKPSIPE